MINHDNIRLYLPQYLSEEDQKDLLIEIQDFRKNPKYNNFFLQKHHWQNYLLQGDGMRAGSLLMCDTTTRDFKNNIPCILLSNTCDISLDYPRSFPLNISYAPIFNLEKYFLLLTEKKDKTFAKNKCDEIRQQLITTYFYLPDNSGLGYEGFVHFDKLCNSANSRE
ncbi:MAG: hypothetical protein WCP55_20860, partial [Lentisphaerota bacterium]